MALPIRGRSIIPEAAPFPPFRGGLTLSTRVRVPSRWLQSRLESRNMNWLGASACHSISALIALVTASGCRLWAGPS
jgi:hypothetical protein